MIPVEIGRRVLVAPEAKLDRGGHGQSTPYARLLGAVVYQQEYSKARIGYLSRNTGDSHQLVMDESSINKLQRSNEHGFLDAIAAMRNHSASMQGR